jgi:hypothetical protein
MQLKLRCFEQVNAAEMEKVNNSTPTTQEEVDRVQLTEGEYLCKHPRRRVTPARVCVTRRQMVEPQFVEKRRRSVS